MNPSRTFILRPVATSLLMVGVRAAMGRAIVEISMIAYRLEIERVTVINQPKFRKLEHRLEEQRGREHGEVEDRATGAVG
jgi:hypothetical protein